MNTRCIETLPFYFLQLSPLLSRLSSVSAMQKMSQFGLELLAADEAADDSLATLLSTFMPAVLKCSAGSELLVLSFQP